MNDTRHIDEVELRTYTASFFKKRVIFIAIFQLQPATRNTDTAGWDRAPAFCGR